MASRKLFYGKPSYIYPYPETETSQNDHNLFDFDESDLYNHDNQFPTSFDAKKPIPILRSSRKPAKTADSASGNRKTKPTSGSLPVNVPDWSKILKSEYRCRCKRDGDDYDDDDDEDGGGGGRVRTPPHEYLARRRGSSFSVHEGNGRTLKGRDLWRVRNAIWEKTGFQD
ncbi:PREDICTED: uncharacterized protein LOC104823238 [Tarenaya hassleriana]|uniref:uncharacterized protein LOC104823238 n=1 Tax=Tarenaya hassleriana TaxID=28532 RepID=UPI00053C7060|nr:PREDICTED: uncharacterized protein LOC104823238 [Tarenaya hassleriana]